MPEVPAGWYPHPDDPLQLRWWTGSEWSTTTAPVPSTKKSQPFAALVAVASIVGALALLGLVTTGVSGFITMIGLGALVVSIIALAKGSLRSFRIPSRSWAALALVGSLTILGFGSAIAPPSAPSGDSSGVQSAGGPEATGSPTSIQPLANGPTEPAQPTDTTYTQEEETIEPIPFDEVSIDAPDRWEGLENIDVVGVPGEKTIVWLVTFSLDGTEIGREQISERVSQKPVTQVTGVGTKVKPAPQPTCDPNYSGACVPIASDVDCAGGSGNGPAYVVGPVRVVGYDIYDLDRDGDGFACD